MSKRKAERIGALIQSYVRAKWGCLPDDGAGTDLSLALGPELRDRIDILGLDGERLLDVAPAAVLAELELLEREAAREDALTAATVARAQQVGKHHKLKNPGRRDSRLRSGRPRKSAGRGRRQQRD
ncbi:MAG: hypothetical protein ACPW60_14015 [Methylohalobius sp. ZOD2]|nr:hypothetical protein [Methylothermaceae bacterium]